MKFSTALALPALFLGALAAPVQKLQQPVDVSNVTTIITDLYAEILPVTAAINATVLAGLTATIDINVQLTAIIHLVSVAVGEVSVVLGQGSNTHTLTNVGDIIDNNPTDPEISLKSRQVPNVGNVDELNKAVTLVVHEISSTLEGAHATNGTAFPTKDLASLGNSIVSLSTVLSIVTDVTVIVQSIVPVDLLSLLGLVAL